MVASVTVEPDEAPSPRMIAETVGITGHDGKPIHAYYSRPLGKESFPGIVLIPHMPGWDEWCRETARRFTAHGYGVVCPNIYQSIDTHIRIFTSS